MKKLLETSLGPWSHTFFSLENRRVSDEEAMELIQKECNSYVTKDEHGVLVYMSREEFKRYNED